MELLRIRLISKLDSRMANRRNPRELQFVDQAVDADRPCAASIDDRWRAPREILLTVTPAGILSEANRRLVRAWLGGRYTRSAMPNAFNERIKPSQKQVEKLFANDDDLTGIYLLTETTELAASEPYRLVLYATMKTSTFGDPSRHERAQKTVDALEAAWGSLDGIEVRESWLVSEADVSLDDIGLWQRWDPFDWTSG